MKALLVLLCAVVSIGFAYSGWEPGPDPEMPMCDHEDCVKLRSPCATRPAQGPDEDPARLYRADAPPSARPYSVPRLRFAPARR